MACLVSQGSRDIGIRMALGATPHDMLLMVVRHGVIVAAIGTILGLDRRHRRHARAGTPAVRYRADRPATFAAVAALLIAVTLIGSYVPARRAAKIDPAVSLQDTNKSQAAPQNIALLRRALQRNHHGRRLPRRCQAYGPLLTAGNPSFSTRTRFSPAAR